MAGKSSKWVKMVRKEQMDEVLEEAETGAQQSEESARPRTGPGFSPKDVGGTDIIQESQLWAMGKGPKLPKNNMEKTLS